jgi:hypothetical protein
MPREGLTSLPGHAKEGVFPRCLETAGNRSTRKCLRQTIADLGYIAALGRDCNPSLTHRLKPLSWPWRLCVGAGNSADGTREEWI